ncbi:RNA polymerase sigma factor [Flavobacterium flavipallidum]|uniref:Sigma-70 family RNA polymerase sigma factor n=1 Tax=Flavobacterium flavipallidum TaxID=3139140 RepID=A0ABU9HNB2_9FLAO
MEEPIDYYIRKCIENDRGAQQKIYQLYAPVLYGLCIKYMKNEEDAKDVFQEAFVVAFQKMNQYRFEGSFEGWLKRIFINKLIETLKKRKRDLLFEDETFQGDIIDEEEDVDVYSIPKEKLVECIQQLPDQYRLVFNLYYFEKMKHKEIALALNISEGTSKSNLNRAKGNLQRRIAALMAIKKD